MLDDDERPETAGDPPGDAAAAAAAAAPGLLAERPRERSASGNPPLGADPSRYILADEPIADGAPVDVRYLFSLVETQLEREDARGRALDAKIATLLAGVVAGIGFSFRSTPSIITSTAALLFVIPFGLIASAYTTKLTQDAPKPSAIAESFPTFPVTTLTSAIAAMNAAYADNRRLHSVKSFRFDLAFLATLAVTTIVLLSQLVVAWRPPNEQPAAATRLPITGSSRADATGAQRIHGTHPEGRARRAGRHRHLIARSTAADDFAYTARRSG